MAPLSPSSPAHALKPHSGLTPRGADTELHRGTATPTALMSRVPSGALAGTRAHAHTQAHTLMHLWVDLHICGERCIHSLPNGHG